MVPSPPFDRDAEPLIEASLAALQRGAHREGADLARLATVQASLRQQPDLVARGQALLAVHLMRSGDLEGAVADANRALEHFASAGPAHELSGVHATLAAAYERASLLSLSAQHADEALKAATAADDPVAECWALIRLGTAMQAPEDSLRGIALLEQAAERARGLPDPALRFAALNNLARRLEVESDRQPAQGRERRLLLARARRAAEDAADLAAAGHPLQTALAAANRAGVLRREGELAEARSGFEQALAMARSIGQVGLVATLELALASLEVEASASAASCAALEEALNTAHQKPGVDGDLKLSARRTLVDGLRRMFDAQQALEQLERLLGETVALLSARADLQARLVINRAELAQARREAERARMDAELATLRAAAEQRTARQLALDRDELERQVQGRTAELQAAKATAESADRAKGVFLSMVSHELRTPLTGLMGMVELARRRATDARQLQQLDKAIEGGQQLLAIVTQLLDYVAADSAGPPALAPVDLRALLDELRLRHAQPVLAKGLVLELDVGPEVPPQIEIDAARVRSILHTLLGNAVKFSPRGTVRVGAYWEADAPRAVLHLIVADQGPGLGPQVMQHLYQPFEPGDAEVVAEIWTAR